ncbi:M4 family metallopeptidase [Actinomadura macra]|uniref:M4 family metallopeptidase n=1 Tax=Actinomadura macra TaxID=46164 RepID=UPI000A62E4D9|nr:M4 family metallopeptidase [Actinomadura macra]
MRHQTAIGAAAVMAVGFAVAMSAPATGATRTAPAAPAGPEARTLAASSADRMVAAQPATFHAAPKDKIYRTNITSGLRGLQYVEYQRTYDGLPVHGGDFVVTTNSGGSVLSTSVNQTKELKVGTKATITAAQAAKTSRAKVGKVDTATTRLMVLAEGSGRLVYETVVSGHQKQAETKLHVLVDAKTGKVVQTWDEVRDAKAADDKSHFHGTVDVATAATSMTDSTRPGHQCGGQNGSAFTGTDSAWGDGSGTNLETACVDTLYAVQKEWDMLKEWLGRNGTNGNGRGFPSRVGLNQVNAFWNGSYTNFGHNQANNKQATSLDVVGHENGHAVFTNTPGGDSGGNEKGGMNESAGDIFGALVEHYLNEPANLDPPDYLVGEEIDLVGQGPIRNMYDPSAKGDPNCYSSSIPNTEVHKAAGPQNHWFYLLAEGSSPTNGSPKSPTCNNSTVAGIGIKKAGQIFMGGLNKKVSAWTHARARTATIAAAVELFPSSAAECTAVKAAWAAVSVPAQSGEAACPAKGRG